MVRRVPSVRVRGKATFHTEERTWTSHLAWAKFILKGDHCVCIGVYQQWPRGGGEPVNPHFKDFEKMRDEAERLLRKPRRRPQPRPATAIDKRRVPPHESSLCECCKELGVPCTGCYVDVCDNAFQLGKREAGRRLARLAEHDEVTLYHQTSEEIASVILQTQEMKPGRQGLAAGGIYFAQSAEDTRGKARRQGVILKCTVRLGRVKELGPNGDSSTDIVRLLNDAKGPFDSVKICRQRPEWVVYMADQVTHIERA